MSRCLQSGPLLRRLLRRVVRSMRLLGVAEPVLPELLPVSRDLMSESYPEVESDWLRRVTRATARWESRGSRMSIGHPPGSRGGVPNP